MLRWTPEFGDLMDAYEARRHALGHRRRAMLLAWLCLLVAVGLMLYTLVVPALVLVLIGLVLATPATGRVMARRSLARLWNANPSLAEPAEATVSETGVTRRGGDDTSWAWPDVPVWIETPELFVLTLSEQRYGAFLTLPKRGVEDPEDVTAVRHLLLGGIGTGLRYPRHWGEPEHV